MQNEFSKIISDIRGGSENSSEHLLPIVYAELHRLATAKMRHERIGHTLGATALVHEAFLRLVDKVEQQAWDSQAHFFAAAAEAMRRILIDQARRKKRIRHGGNHKKVNVDISNLSAEDKSNSELDLIALDAALSELHKEQPALAELVKLHQFAGLTWEEIAKIKDVSLSTVNRNWKYARARLFELMTEYQESCDL